MKLTVGSLISTIILAVIPLSRSPDPKTPPPFVKDFAPQVTASAEAHKILDSFIEALNIDLRENLHLTACSSPNESIHSLPQSQDAQTVHASTSAE